MAHIRPKSNEGYGFYTQQVILCKKKKRKKTREWRIGYDRIWFVAYFEVAVNHNSYVPDQMRDKDFTHKKWRIRYDAIWFDAYFEVSMHHNLCTSHIRWGIQILRKKRVKSQIWHSWFIAYFEVCLHHRSHTFQI